MNRPDTSLEELNQWMLAHHMHGYWMQEGGGSGPPLEPHLWKWADIYAGLLKAAAPVPPGPSGPTELRPLTLSSSKGLRDPNERSIPKTISLSPHILMPARQNDGLSPVQRNAGHWNAGPSPVQRNAARFVIQASPGAIFVVEGEAFPMEAGDLVVSPAGTDHHHYNGGAEPAIWLDGLDLPLLNFMGTEISERYPLPPHPSLSPDKPAGYFSATQDRMKASSTSSAYRRPPVRYPWTDTFATLTALRESEVGADPSDGIHLRYTSPLDRGPTLPTFSCEIQLLTPGLPSPARSSGTLAHRHNSTAIYYVFRGEGRTEVAGEWLEWAQGDIFSVPPWTWHRHENPASEDAILYSVDDWPAMAKLGFYRMEGHLA